MVSAQTTYLPLHSDEQHLLDRLETSSGVLSDELFLSTQPISRKQAVDFLINEKSDFYNRGLTNVDNYNINRALSISSEWVDYNRSLNSMNSRPLLGVFYQNKGNFYQHRSPNFFIAVNPVLSLQGVYQNASIPSRKFLLSSSQGLSIRARIYNHVGLNLNITNNYEQTPSYFGSYVYKNNSLPGVGKYKATTGYQYILPTGYIDVALLKNYVHASAGYDYHFIGDGIRSLFISDFSAPMPFVSINTKIWKLNYQNLYMAAMPQFAFDSSMRRGQYKYFTMHHLSANITKWLNIGVFESVSFARDGGFEIGYMNPIIFYRAVERSLGSPDHVAIGMDVKAFPVKTLQLYGQFLINEFTAKYFFSNQGYMHNKWGLQLGFKYFNALTIDNLDLQAELNMVRPYTYQHYTSGNFSNNNLPLAHPLGAGFREMIGRMRYQPIPKLSITAQVVYYQEGVDTGGVNFGNDVTRDYHTAPNKFGVRMINGEHAQGLVLGLNASYELIPNLYFDFGATYRKYTSETKSLGLDNSTGFVNAGLRLNIAKRDYWSF